MKATRVFHCTFYKCGSQWVRDVLREPEVIAVSGCTLSVSGVDIPSSGWPEVPNHTLASPLYTAGIADWLLRKDIRENDRLITIVRDPRDVVVSLVFSMGYSHTPDGINKLLRSAIRNAKPDDRLRLGMHLLLHWSDQMFSWFDYQDDTSIVVRYEDLIRDEVGMFRRMVDFLEWPLSDEDLKTVVGRHTFKVVAGRNPGEENKFSHRRKGIAGDWRTHFTREIGQEFEDTFPDMLRRMGYAESNDWWEDLPQRVPEKLDSIEAERRAMQQVLEAHKEEVAVVHAAADERLRDINSLQLMYEEVARERDMYMQAAEQRLADLEQSNRDQLALAEEAKLYREAASARESDQLRLSEMLATVTAQCEQYRLAAEARLSDLQVYDSKAQELETSAQVHKEAAELRENEIVKINEMLRSVSQERDQFKDAAETRLKDLMKSAKRLESVENEMRMYRQAADDREKDLLAMAELLARSEAEKEQYRLAAEQRLPEMITQISGERQMFAEAAAQRLERLERAAQELVEANSKIEFFSHAAVEREQELARLNEMLKAALAQCEMFRSAADDREEKINELTGLLAESQSQTELYAAAAEERLEQLERAEKARETQAEELRLYQRAAEEREQNVTELTHLLGQMRAELDVYTAAADDRLVALQRAEEYLQTLDQEVRNQHAAANVFEQGLTALRAELTSVTNERNQLRIEQDVQSQKLRDSLESAERIAAERDMLRLQLSDLKARLDSINAALTETSEKVKAINEQAETRQKLLNEIEHNLMTVTEERNMFRWAAEERLAKLTDMAAELGRLRHVAAEREQGLMTLSQTLTSVSADRDMFAHSAQQRLELIEQQHKLITELDQPIWRRLRRKAAASNGNGH